MNKLLLEVGILNWQKASEKKEKATIAIEEFFPFKIWRPKKTTQQDAQWCIFCHTGFLKMRFWKKNVTFLYQRSYILADLKILIFFPKKSQILIIKKRIKEIFTDFNAFYNKLSTNSQNLKKKSECVV